MRRSIRIISGAGLLAGLVLCASTARAQGTRWTSKQDSATWAGVSGQLRLRAEGWTGFGAGAPAGADHDDAFALSRLLLRGELHVRGALIMVAELKSSVAVSRDLPGGRRTADEDVFDVQQLYAAVEDGSGATRLSFRAGRFDLALGRERLVSPLDWTNTRRTFQGASLRVSRHGATAQLVVVHPVLVARRKPNHPDSSRSLYGLYLSRTGSRAGADLYWLRTVAVSATFNGTTGTERRHTVGSRLFLRPSAGRADAELEFAAQAGWLGAANLRAWMVAAQLGRSFGGSARPRVYAGLDAASGDRSPGGAVNTFNQLYPLSHAYLGYADVHGRQNVIALSLGGSLQATPGIAIQVDAHDFRRASRADALYGADGSVSRPAGTANATGVGTELDVTVRATAAGGRVILQTGASRYVAGAFLRQTGPGRDISWVYWQATATF